uniref:HEAT repeat-containing protein 1 n=1 Tax=Sander lucioperca TaxID=283035 RepID=A0A8D0CS34_SANLU
MTSLAQQLKRLALPQSDPNLLTRREVASLLFDPKDAASMDRSTFYALGCTGLEELLGIEPAFLEFQDTLFSRASLTLERSVQSKEVNEKLDAGVSLFLARLCPYFLLKPAHKCIEWLLHRFHIQLYNSESLLACALPYHDTNVFVRVVQLLRIKDATNRWNWLQGLQKPGVPLSRGTLITHCHSDLSFMDFICSLVTKSIQAYAGHSGSCSQLRVIFSFYASTIVAALDAVDAVSDTIIAKLLPYVNKGLKSALTDYKAATYMIVCQLAVKVVMEASLVDTLAAHVAKSLLRAPVLAREGVGCLTVLLQNQKEGAAGAFERLGSMPALASTLQAMAVAHDVTPLLRYLLPHLIHAAFTCSSGENGNHRLVHTTDSDMEIVFIQQYVLKRSFYYLLFFTCLASGPCPVLAERVSISISISRVFVSVSVRYCAALDAVLAAHVSSSEQKHLFHRFLSLSTSSGKYQIMGDSDTSLLLSLKHPQPSVRVSALEHLMDATASGQVRAARLTSCSHLAQVRSEPRRRSVPIWPRSVLMSSVHLPEPAMLFRFLCLLWGYGSNHGDQLDVKVGAVLQTQALYMGGALLNATPPALMQELLAAHSPVFPSLLCCLTSPLREVRRAGLAALQSLSAAGASPFQPITERLLKTSEEILADPSYLSQVTAEPQTLIHSQQKKLEASLHLLLQSVQTPCCPSYSAGGLLRALSLVNGPSVLSRLLPVLDRLLEQSGPDAPSLLRAEAQLVQLILGKFSEASAPLLAEDHNCLDLFVRALRSSAQPHADIPSCQITALEQMTKPLFSALGDTAAVQQKLLAVMFDVLVESRSPLVANTVSSAFKGIAVDAQLVANELAPPEKPKVSVTVQQSRRSRMTQRFTHGGAVPWRRVTLILELLQHKKKLQRAQTLVPALFSLLARSLEVCPGDHTNMEYTKQLLLSCLLNVLHKLSPDGSAVATDVLDEEKFSVELVVQVIRASDMPQTHHHALLLLGAAAAIFPEKVLHNIMPIFTFMGANIMRLDDAYSFRVIDRTVQMVIPALIQLSDGSASSPLVAVVTRIMHVFADALPHVPEHRRLPILRQLVTTLGPAHFLWVLMLLLFKLHATQSAAQSAASDKDEALEKDVDFWISLCCEFSVNDQLTSIINILNFLLQLPDDTPKRKKSPEEEVLDLIFSPEAHSSKELRHFKFLSVCFMAQLLGSSSFIGKVRQTDESLQSLQQRLLEEILRYVHSVARCVENSADKPTAKFWRVLLNKTYDVLDKVNSLLPTDTFITVMRGLMGNDLPSVRRKAMELLNNKLTQRTPWDDSQVSVLLQLTDDLLSIVGKRGGADAEPAINRQTALYSLKLLCRGVGSQRRDAFGPVLLRAVDIVAAGDEDRNVTGSALLCVAELVGTLKALAIPQLPRLMPAVLQALTDRKELLTNEIYLLSAVTALQRVTETLPHFISPYLDDVCRLTRFVASPSPSSAASQLAVRLASLRSTLATALPPRVLLPTVARCYSSMVLDRKVRQSLQHIGQMEKEPLSFHQSELTSFFLSALDFRAQHCQGDLKKTAEIEGCVIDCLIAMVMKLSEVTFRPLFFKLLDWSKSGSTERLLTFYRLSDFIAERLKGLFVLFAGNLVKPFADLLRQTNGSQTDALLFESCGEEKVSLLLSFVLDCLQKIFLFDTQRFLSRERADALLTPLVDQLENSVGGQQAYEQRVTQHLVPCVGQFSVALADDALWKTLNYQILLKTRHADSKVRFSALVMLMELASKLKENYMVLLPETIPFLAELMEDECEEVEQQVQKVVQEMENILGEPLQSYF